MAKPPATPSHWVVLTGEYPPQAGGVSDYTRLVCAGLIAAGDRVTVFAPPCVGDDVPGRVAVVRLPDHFGRRGRAVVTESLRANRPDRVLVQYVPHAFGMKAMNLPFAWWLRHVLRRITPVWVMVHEVAFPFVRRPLKHNLLALLNRLMARWVAAAASRLFVTIPAWADMLRRLAPRSPSAEWLPVPSNLPTITDMTAVRAVRTALHARTLIGHFGTYSRSVTDLLAPCLDRLLRSRPDRRALLIGRNSKIFRDSFLLSRPELFDQVTATDELSTTDATNHLAACDLVVQPYPDGVSGRRTSVISVLALGVPIVTNTGRLTEAVWQQEATGLGLACSPSPHELCKIAELMLAETVGARAERSRLSRQWYQSRFAIEHTIRILRRGM